jgi:RNA polymerase subunit RPABC4/transcription elongation factor Spt4
VTDKICKSCFSSIEESEKTCPTCGESYGVSLISVFVVIAALAMGLMTWLTIGD